MKYTVYSGEDKVQIPDFNVNPGRIWEKDTTELSLDINNGYLYYYITNPSARTQYLLENNNLGLGIFVEENPSWLPEPMRSKTANKNHPARHCVKVIRINKYSGVYKLDDMHIYNYENIGCLSNQLAYVFRYSSDFKNPYRPNGVENVAIGIGRMYSMDENKYSVCCFRPYKVGNYMEIEVVNKW